MMKECKILFAWLIITAPSLAAARRADARANATLDVATVRNARDAILRDIFLGRKEIADGLWFEDGGLEGIAARIQGARREGRNFVMTFGGTSITAGHDNYFNQTYPEVFRRLAQESFSIAGVPLLVRNVAHGANPHIPYSLCARCFYGVQSDVVSIEMKVMSKARQGKKVAREKDARGHSTAKKVRGLATSAISEEEKEEHGTGGVEREVPKKRRRRQQGPKCNGQGCATRRRLTALATTPPVKWASAPATMAEVLLRQLVLLPRRPAVLFADGVYGGPRKPHGKGSAIIKRTASPPSNWPELDSTVTFEHTAITPTEQGVSRLRLNSSGSGGSRDGVARFNKRGRENPTDGVVSKRGRSLLRHYGGYGLGLHRLDVGVATWFVDHEQEGPFGWEALNGNKAFEHIGWHPGPGSHALRGALLAYGYLAALELALADRSLPRHRTTTVTTTAVTATAEEEEEDRHHRRALPPFPSAGPLTKFPKAPSTTPPPLPTPAATPLLPAPLLCEPWLCGSKVQCASSYVPQSNDDDDGDDGTRVHTRGQRSGGFGRSNSLGSLVAVFHPHLAHPEPLEPLLEAKRGGPHRGERHLGTNVKGSDPSSSSSSSSGSESSSTGKENGGGGGCAWRHVLFSKTLSAVRQAVQQKRGYLDRKFVLQSPPGRATRTKAGRNPNRLTLVLPRGGVHGSKDAAAASNSSTGSCAKGRGCQSTSRLVKQPLQQSQSQRKRRKLSADRELKGDEGKSASGSTRGVGEEGGRSFVALCYPWTGQAPKGWVPITKETVVVWVNGRRIGGRQLAKEEEQGEFADDSDAGVLSGAVVDFPTPLASAQLADGPCLTVLLGPTQGSHEDGLLAKNNRGESSSAPVAYFVEVEPSEAGKHITISHVLWR